jgi:rubrerythrin
VDIVQVLTRSIRAENAAAEVYLALAERFAADGALRDLFRELAGEEREHARNLVEWRTRLEGEPSEQRPIPAGFEGPFAGLEETLRALDAKVACAATPDDAFAIALELESGELDGIYDVLGRSAEAHDPHTRFARADEHLRHHGRLLAAVRLRSRDEVVLLRASLLEARQPR